MSKRFEPLQDFASCATLSVGPCDLQRRALLNSVMVGSVAGLLIPDAVASALGDEIFRDGFERPIGQLPAYVAGKPLNQWFEVPNTNVTTLATATGTVPAGIMDDYSGLAFNKLAGKVAAFGGGHGGSTDNTVAEIDMLADAPTWSVLCQPTPPAQRISAPGGGFVSENQLWWGTAPDKKPNPPHTYSSGQWVEEFNSYVWFGYFAPHNFGGGIDGRTLRLIKNGAVGSWAQPQSADDLGLALGARNTCLMGGKVYGMASGQTLFKFDPSALPGARWSTVANNNALNWSGFGALVPDETRSRIFRVGDYFTDRFFTIDIPSGVVTNINPLLTGAANVLAGLRNRVGVDTVGCCYDVFNDRYIVPTGLAGGAFYAINAATWAVTLVSPASVSGTVPSTPIVGGNSTGIFARVFVIEQAALLVMWPRGSANAWAMRLQ